MEEPLVSLSKKHAGHLHTVNIKYGYVILFLSGLHILLSVVASYAYYKKWTETGSPANRLKPLVSVPLWFKIILWATTIGFLSVYHIEELSENYTVAVKRLGRVAYALIPFNIFLVLRPQNVTSFSWGFYLQSISIHKWISRLIFVCAILHGVGFFYKWIVEGTFFAKSFKLLNSLGIVVFTLALILSVISVRYLRRKFYAYFYLVHSILAWSFVILISFHARPGVLPISIIALALLGIQAYSRYFNTYSVSDVEVHQNSAISSLEVIKIAKPVGFAPTYLPASHIRVAYPNVWFFAWLVPTHPYTLLAPADDDSSTLDLIVRHSSHIAFNPTAPKYTISGPFPSLPEPFFRSALSLDVICGGSGISFGIPLVRYFNARSIPITLIWCVRSSADLHVLDHVDTTITNHIKVYVTASDAPLFQVDDEASHGLLNPDGTSPDIELGELSGKSNVDPESKPYNRGRPVLDEVLGTNSVAGSHWVIACGPESLITAAKSWSKVHNTHFFSEHYEM